MRISVCTFFALSFGQNVTKKWIIIQPIDLYKNMWYNVSNRNFQGRTTDYEAYQDTWNKESLQERKERWLRRMPDILPVRLQDKLRYRKSAVRKQEVIKYDLHKRRRNQNGGCFFE